MTKLMTWEIADLNSRIRQEINSATGLMRSFTMTQMHALVFLLHYSDKDICQKDLETEMGLKKASITGLIDTLEKRGYIYREQSKDDRRKNYIRLTPEALAYKDIIYDKFRELDEVLKKDISEKELQQFFLIAEKIKNNIRTINDRK